MTIAASAAGVLALAGGCGWPAVPTPLRPLAGSPAAGIPTCSATSLAPEVRDDQGTAGTQRFRVVLTNRSTSTCTVLGYPVLVLRDADGRLLPPARPSGESKTVRLDAGRSASATLTVTPAGCPEVALASTAAVSPPGSGHSTKLPVQIPVCRPLISPVAG